MDWITRLNTTIHYIEEHLAEDIDYAALGKIACCSSYHYQRMFAYMAGVPLSEYIRRRRMTLAAADLQNGDKIIDVALKYGYASPTAFNRAFQVVHGVAPSLAKNSGVSLKSFSPIGFKITIKGAEEMEYRMEKKDAFRIVGISQPLCKEVEESFKVVPQMWYKAGMDGTIGKFAPLMNAEPMGILGVSACADDDEWRYYIAVSTTVPCGEFEEYTVPAATWAIFYGEGTNLSIQELEKRIVTEWLPSSGYEYTNAPEIEVYLNPDPQNAKFEVWVPVAKKA
ncbi:MAG: AraC family transcriptional regulator [Clostridiales bacterium]|nr:AraC family transcriptional regulator [Clostridiales bacterium]